MTESRNLPCELTPDERLSFTNALIAAQIRREEVEEQKRIATASFTKHLVSIKGDIHHLNTILHRGYEMRQVKCEVKFDSPAKGMAQIIRTDTGEVVDARSMTDEERQRDLFVPERAKGAHA